MGGFRQLRQHYAIAAHIAHAGDAAQQQRAQLLVDASGISSAGQVYVRVNQTRHHPMPAQLAHAGFGRRLPVAGFENVLDALAGDDQCHARQRRPAIAVNECHIGQCNRFVGICLKRRVNRSGTERSDKQPAQPELDERCHGTAPFF